MPLDRFMMWGTKAVEVVVVALSRRNNALSALAIDSHAVLLCRELTTNRERMISRSELRTVREPTPRYAFLT